MYHTLKIEMELFDGMYIDDKIRFSNKVNNSFKTIKYVSALVRKADISFHLVCDFYAQTY